MCHSILEDYENGELAEYELADSYEARWNKDITEEFPYMRYGSISSSFFKGSAVWLFVCCTDSS